MIKGTLSPYRQQRRVDQMWDHGSNSLKCNTWLLGIITDLLRGHYNHIRYTAVKIANGLNNRPTSKLYLLEVYTRTNLAVKLDIEQPADDADATKTSDKQCCHC